MFGTYVNTVAVIAGSLVGVLLHRELPDRIKKVIFQGIGLMVLFIGMQMALKTSNLVILFSSILIGAVAGEVIDVERHLDRLGNFLKTRSRSKDERFIDGFVTASLVCCVGSMAIVGAIEDGIRGDPSTLLAKSVLDGFVSISFASALGMGVLFSALSVLAFQGGITLLAQFLKTLLTDTLMNELSAVGGILLLGLAIDMLEIKEIKVGNLLPSLFVVVCLARLLPV